MRDARDIGGGGGGGRRGLGRKLIFVIWGDFEFEVVVGLFREMFSRYLVLRLV